RHLAVDEQLGRRRHERVSDLGARERHARDRRARADDRRPADHQPNRVVRVEDGAIRDDDEEHEGEHESSRPTKASGAMHLFPLPSHDYCSWRTISCARLSPRMISTLVEVSGATATAAAADLLVAMRVRATADFDAPPNPSSAAGRMPGVVGIVLS